MHVTIEQPIEQEEVYIKTQLTAMHLALENATGQMEENISSIDSFSKLDVWANACGLAFGYDINITSLIPLLDDENATILAFQVNGQIAGTAVIYQTNNNMGVHQVGVLPSFQKRGIGKTIMLHIMAVSKKKACKTMTLQASQSGLPMYLNLGFIPLADIFHLEKNSSS